MENGIKLGLSGVAVLAGLYVTVKGISKLVRKARSHSENNRKKAERTINNVITSLQNFEEDMMRSRDASREIFERMKIEHEEIQRQHVQNHLDTIIVPH